MASLLLRVALVASSIGLPTVVAAGCSSSDDGSSSGSGGSSGSSGSSGGGPDSAVTGDGDTPSDAARDAAADASGTGETCVGFARSMPCGAGGLPPYGYVCFHGSPPGIAGCVLASSTGSFGDTYCCAENACVAQPDQDKECPSAATPHRFQCPPAGDGGALAPPPGCVVGSGSGGSSVESFYCCP
ncbi:MAG: hypothetical protein JWP97_3209 [Labilithrix sp.]|nr:hypothetical protein [Labilithrix sp.]